MADMEDRVALNVLLDFYGPLLTAHKQEVLRLYCEEDMSLQEIADQLEITRQGVHDAVAKARRQLMGYEEKLGLVERFNATRDAISSISGEIDEAIKLAAAKASDPAAGDVSKRLRKIRSELEQLDI